VAVPQGQWHRFQSAEGVSLISATPLPTQSQMSVPAGVNRSGRSGQVDLGGLIAVPGTAGIGADQALAAAAAKDGSPPHPAVRPRRRERRVDPASPPFAGPRWHRRSRPHFRHSADAIWTGQKGGLRAFPICAACDANRSKAVICR